MIEPADLIDLYPTPDPNRSDFEHDRYWGNDIPSLLDEELRCELTALRFINAFTSNDWHKDRAARVVAELQARYRRDKAQRRGRE